MPEAGNRIPISRKQPLPQGHHTSQSQAAKRFYEAAVLLIVLSKSQRDHIDEDPLGLAAEPSDLVNSYEIRRNFLKQLAYICDSEKGGDTTTAIAEELNATRASFVDCFK
jgi:hypothetical protein